MAEPLGSGIEDANLEREPLNKSVSHALVSDLSNETILLCNCAAEVHYITETTAVEAAIEILIEHGAPPSREVLHANATAKVGQILA